MKLNKLTLIAILATSFSLVACGPSDTPTLPSEPTVPTTTYDPTTDTGTTTPMAETFLITFVNYDDSVLYTTSVVENTMPVYEGSAPIKPADNNYMYKFIGWTPELHVATQDETYKATYEAIEKNDDEKYIPKLSSDGKYIEYGLYPQTYVSDSNIVNQLNNLTPSVNGWINYLDEYYCKVTANVYNNESYTFNNGDSIVNNNEYWFKVEPIKWQVISANKNQNSYEVISTVLLDTSSFYKDYEMRKISDKVITPNDYEHSDIRQFLNNEFKNSAFHFDDTHLYSVNFGTYQDDVYLLSKNEYTSSDYGFDSSNGLSKTRECKTTDYAIANGAWYSKDSGYTYNGTYFTRTPSDKYNYCVETVNSGGYISSYAVDGSSHCIRPSVIIAL